jgi:hypothetical protein
MTSFIYSGRQGALRWGGCTVPRALRALHQSETQQSCGILHAIIYDHEYYLFLNWSYKFTRDFWQRGNLLQTRACGGGQTISEHLLISILSVKRSVCLTTLYHCKQVFLSSFENVFIFLIFKMILANNTKYIICIYYIITYNYI